LLELDTTVSPDTLLRWHRRLVAQVFAERRGVGRPGIMRHISELIVRMAQENRGWGYTRIKWCIEDFAALLEAAGFRARRHWGDARGWFAVFAVHA
jgi:hypothetical protein